MVVSMTVKCSDYVAEKNKPKCSPLHVWQLTLDVCAIFLSLNVALCIMAKHPHFGLVNPNGQVTEVWRFVQSQLCKPEPCCCAMMYFLDRRGVLDGKLSKPPHLFSLFPVALSWTLTFILLAGLYTLIWSSCFIQFLWALHSLTSSTPGKISNCLTTQTPACYLWTMEMAL